MAVTNKVYRIALVEPSPMVRAGLRAMLETDKLFKIVGWSADTNRLGEHLAAMQADVAIVNPTVIEFHRRLAIKSVFQEFPDMMLVGLAYGYVDAEVPKQFAAMIDIYDEPDKIVSKLHSVVENAIQAHEASENYELSEREKEILVAVAKGMTNKEIALVHHISIHTVISHRKNISRKTGIKSVSGMTVYALLNNLLSQDDIY